MLILYNKSITKTTHNSYPDGMQVYEFHNTNQKEYHFPDGRIEIELPNGSKRIFKEGTVETIMANGIKMSEHNFQMRDASNVY